MGGDRDPLAGLMAAAGRGDERAARGLLAALGPRCFNLARRMLNDAAEAEDVVQEAFIRLWRTAPTWRPGAAQVATWAHRVTVNLCLDRLRRAGRVEPTAEPPDVADPAPLPSAVLEADDRAAAVRAALARLPERQRAAVALCCFDEMTNIEAARVLDVSVEALESLLARARRALKAMLAPMNEEAA